MKSNAKNIHILHSIIGINTCLTLDYCEHCSCFKLPIHRKLKLVMRLMKFTSVFIQSYNAVGML